MDIKKLLKKKYGDSIHDLGIPMPSELAFELDEIIKGLPQECRERGLIRKCYSAKKLEVDVNERTDMSIITNDAVDRDNEVIMPGGLDWKQFKKAGMPVPFAHDYTALPVGRGLGVWRERPAEKSHSSQRDGWAAKTLYATRPEGWSKDAPWLPDAILSMIDQKMLGGKSIGFIPTEYSSPTPQEIELRSELANVSYVIRKAIVIEYSVAPIQSNPEALVLGTKSYAKDLTERAMEHLGIYLPTDIDYNLKSKSSCAEEIGNYKVVKRLSNQERLRKALEKM